MKKLLALTLVLGIASLATAGIDLASINGLSYAVEGNKLTVSSTVGVIGYLFNLQADNGSALTNGTVAGGFAAVNFAGIDQYGIWTGASASVGTANPLTGPIFSIDFTPGTQKLLFVYSSGDPSITIGGEAITLTGYEMTIVPEPMTMGLLGLGSLFLARRKK